MVLPNCCPAVLGSKQGTADEKTKSPLFPGAGAVLHVHIKTRTKHRTLTDNGSNNKRCIKQQQQQGFRTDKSLSHRGGVGYNLPVKFNNAGARLVDSIFHKT